MMYHSRRHDSSAALLRIINAGCLGDTCNPVLLLSLALKIESREHWWNDADKGKLRY
jgi:hypothetical protein